MVSVIWNNFSKLHDRKGECNICGIPIKIPDGSTSAARKHLKNKHSIDLNERPKSNFVQYYLKLELFLEIQDNCFIKEDQNN